MKAHVGLISLWTGQIEANMEHIKNMCIHQMNDEKVDQFAEYVRHVGYAINSLSKHIKEVQESE